MRLFTIRLISTTSLYLLLANANTLFTTKEHAVLFGGYRLLLIFTPIFTLFLKTWTMFFLLIGASIASFYCIYETNLFVIFVLTLGFSCGGFLIKKQAAETLRSVGYNKWALTFGHIVAGLLVPYLLNNKFLTFILVGLFLACSSILSIFSSINDSYNKIEKKFLIHTIQPTQCIAWILCGSAIGIRVTSLLMIMPQYLLKFYKVIPNWYGIVLSIYGSMVILSQFPAILKKNPSFSFFSALLVLFISCFILALPSLFYVQTWWGALFWLFCLAIEEVFAPYIDVEASVQQTLLYKEIGIGIGACLSVYLMRSYQSPWLIGSIGLVFIVLSYILGITRK